MFFGWFLGLFFSNRNYFFKIDCPSFLFLFLLRVFGGRCLRPVLLKKSRKFPLRNECVCLLECECVCVWELIELLKNQQFFTALIFFLTITIIIKILSFFVYFIIFVLSVCLFVCLSDCPLSVSVNSCRCSCSNVTVVNVC